MEIYLNHPIGLESRDPHLYYDFNNYSYYYTLSIEAYRHFISISKEFKTNEPIIPYPIGNPFFYGRLSMKSGKLNMPQMKFVSVTNNCIYYSDEDLYNHTNKNRHHYYTSPIITGVIPLTHLIITYDKV